MEIVTGSPAETEALAQRLAALTVVAALMAGLSVPAFAATYNIGDGSITIEANGDGTAKVTQNETVNEKDDDVIVKGSGETTSNVIEVINNTEDDLKITLSDVDIADTKGKAPLSVSGTGDTTIELDGNNSLTGSGWSAGLERNEEKDAAGNVVSGKLTIQDENKNGSLEATGNYGGAGIGGGNLKNSGEIEITGGTITATGALDGAGIGGGGSGGDGTVTISGGTVLAAGGSGGMGMNLSAQQPCVTFGSTSGMMGGKGSRMSGQRQPPDMQNFDGQNIEKPDFEGQDFKKPDMQNMPGQDFGGFGSAASLMAENTAFSILDAQGNTLYSGTARCGTSFLLFSSSELSEGNSCTLSADDTDTTADVQTGTISSGMGGGMGFPGGMGGQRPDWNFDSNGNGGKSTENAQAK